MDINILCLRTEAVELQEGSVLLCEKDDEYATALLLAGSVLLHFCDKDLEKVLGTVHVVIMDRKKFKKKRISTRRGFSTAVLL